MSTQETAALVREFIEEVWNKHNPEVLDKYLAENFFDHDNRTTATGVAALKQWISAMNATFDHQTIIEEQITENDLSALRITFRVIHTGDFRGIAATGKQAETTGYRFFRVADGKIVEHWGKLDGDSLVQQLKAVEAA
jgi:predicted ester cyclase